MGVKVAWNHNDSQVRNLKDLREWILGGKNPTRAGAKAKQEAITARARIAYKLLFVNGIRKWFGLRGLSGGSNGG